MYSERILIKNGRIWDGFRFITGDVALNEKEIVAVGNAEGFQPNITFDAQGDIIAPGLVDIHTHLRYLATPTYEINGEVVCFPNGVTAAAEAGVLQETGFCSYTSLALRLFISVSVHDRHADFTATERMIRFYGDKVIGVKICFDKSFIGECDATPLKETCEYARSKNLKVMVHCSDSPIPMAELLACLAPGDICTHIYQGVGHTSAEDGFECLREARKRGIILDTGLAGGVHTDFEIAEQAVKSGVLPDTISTDITSFSAFKRGGKYGMGFAMSMMRQFGMTEESILRCVTTSAAAAIGLSDRCGVLEPGRPSDVTVLRYTDLKMDIQDKKGHVLLADKGYVCMLTVCGGYLVYRSDLF